jgi:hypothetical protein
MVGLRHVSTLIAAILIAATMAAPAVNAANPNTGRSDGVQQPSNSDLTGGWHFVRTRNPHGGADAISIMHTADTSRSDLDLAGLMIRCSEGGTEVAIVLIRAFPLRARPHVVLGKPGTETQLEATVGAPGTAVLLPADATALVNGSWQTLSELTIRIDDGQTTIRGVVALAGLQAAFNRLVASCRIQ